MKEVDARTLACPMPVVLTRRAIADDIDGEGVLVRVDDEIAAQNIEKMAGQCAWHCTRRELDGEIQLTVCASQIEQTEKTLVSAQAQTGDLVVAICADHMGEGDDALGKQLLRAFLFALTQGDSLPKTILFYNGGARLTCRDSKSLEDLKTLQSAGVELLTCGTCLDFYGLKEELAIGEVTNMYAIVTTLTNAAKVVKP